MSANSIYDFETPIEHGVALSLSAAGLNVCTPIEFFVGGESVDEQTFQKHRPRVEIVFTPSGEKKSYAVMQDGSLMNASWTGALTCYVISGIDIAEHRSYRASLRRIMALLRNTINTTLDYHKIQNWYESGSSVDYKPEDGYFTSTITYQVDFGIDAGAWAELA